MKKIKKTTSDTNTILTGSGNYDAVSQIVSEHRQHKTATDITTQDRREEISWDDAYHLTDTWLGKEAIAEKYKEGAFRCKNIGWVIYEDKKYVILAGKRDERHLDYGFVMMLPKGMITKRKKLS